jgi:two-component system sensor kinase FixL
VLTLTGTTLLAGDDRGLVNLRSLTIVATFCLCLAICGEVLRRVRHQERQTAMRAARREAVLQVMFDESPAVMLVVDEDDRIVAANAAAGRLFDVPQDELVGRPADAFVATADEAGEPQRIVVPGGRSLVLRASKAPLTAADRTVRLIYVRDETAAVEAAEQLATTQRELYQIARATALGQFGSSIAHELNQPLAFVANYAGAARAMLTRARPDVDAAIRAVDDALAQVFRASAVLKRLRDFIARRPSTLEWQSVEDVLGDALRLGRLAVKEVDAALTVDLPPSAGQVLADGVQLQQLVVNLLLNAADAVRGQARRVIALHAAETAPGTLTVSVEDSGPGVPPTEAENVFNPFRSTKTDGVGIGLAICRTIVEAHGGRIWCDADTTLGGARFAFTLPRREQGSIGDAV